MPEVILSDEQKEFLKSSGKVVLSACPGSGKTHVVAQMMIDKMKNWNNPHQGIAVLSFTNIASKEITEQTMKLIPGGFEIRYPHYVGTLDSFINNFIVLRFGYLLLSSMRRPTILMSEDLSKKRNWPQICHKQGCVNSFLDFRWGSDGNLYKRNKLVMCEYNKSQKKLPCFLLKRNLSKKGLFFQGDVPALAYFLFNRYPHIIDVITKRFPIIILDEAQDTSKEQMAVLDSLSSGSMQSIYLVGDADQSIYEWRDATPECFIEKIKDPTWNDLYLTENFRSSQLICNATKSFSMMFHHKVPSIAKGEYSSFTQKPVLIIYDHQNKELAKEALLNRFFSLCEKCDISVSPESTAIVTRSRVNKETNIVNLWKSIEIEFFAQSAYEFQKGSRKKAYDLCEKSVFSLCIGELETIVGSINTEIESKIPYTLWRHKILRFLTNLPSIDLPIGEWVKSLSTTLEELLSNVGLSIRKDKPIIKIIKIKTLDKTNPEFKYIPLEKFFENKNQDKYTHSSVHGVKGQTYDALMLVIEGTKGKTLTPSFLQRGDINSELMRIAYVAMTRPRKLLVVSMPGKKDNKEYTRFPKKDWDYEYI